MRIRLLLAFVVLWVPAMAGNLAPKPVYEEDVHFFLTYVLMRLACFSHEEALQIASADQAVDDDVNTEPLAGGLFGHNSKWHAFGTKEEIAKRKKELWDKACKSKSLVDFGIYLHFQEDTHSHVDDEGKPYGPTIGHAKDLRQPDRVPHNKQRAREMAKEKLEDARKFMSDCLQRAPAAMVPDDIISGLIDALSLAYSLAATGGYNEANLDEVPVDLQRILDKWFKEGKIAKEIKVPTKADKLPYDLDGDGKVVNQDEIDKKLKALTESSYVDPKIIKSVRMFTPPYAIQGDTILCSAVVELNQPLPGENPQKTADAWAKDWFNPGDEKILTSTVVAPDAKTMVVSNTIYMKRFGWATIAYVVGSRFFHGQHESGAVCTYPSENRPTDLPVVAPKSASTGSIANLVGAFRPGDAIVIAQGDTSTETQPLASSSCSAAFALSSSLSPGTYTFGIKHADATVTMASSPTEVYSATYHINPGLARTGEQITVSCDLDRAPASETVFVVQNLSQVMKLAEGDIVVKPVTSTHVSVSGTGIAPGQVSVAVLLTDRLDARMRQVQGVKQSLLGKGNPAVRLLGPWNVADMPAPPWAAK